MKKSYIYLIGLFFIFYILFNFYKEGYINIYGPEEFFKPDYSFLHKYRCNNNNEITDPRLIFQRDPNEYYNIKEIKKEGTYTSFLDIYDLRNNYNINKLCDSDDEIEYRYKNNNIDNQFRLIPGAFPEEDIQKIYKDELIKDANDFKKPLNLFTNSEKLKNYIIYPEKIQNNILNNRIKPISINRPDREGKDYYKT